jgi:hypothetical protein
MEPEALERFDNTGPGNWGNKRQAVSITSNPSPLMRITSSMSNNEPVAPIPATAPSAAIAQNSPTPQIEFTPAQDEELLKFARTMVESATNPQFFSGARLPDELAKAPAYGLFVSLLRGDQLRACKGQWANGVGGGLGSEDARAAAAKVRDSRVKAVVIDTNTAVGSGAARELARIAGGEYVRLGSFAGPDIAGAVRDRLEAV